MILQKLYNTKLWALGMVRKDPLVPNIDIFALATLKLRNIFGCHRFYNQQHVTFLSENSKLIHTEQLPTLTEVLIPI